MGLFDIFGGGGDIIRVDHTFGGPIKTTSSPIFPSTSSPFTQNLTGGEVVVIGGIAAAIVAVAKWLFDEKVDEVKLRA